MARTGLSPAGFPAIFCLPGILFCRTTPAGAQLHTTRAARTLIFFDLKSKISRFVALNNTIVVVEKTSVIVEKT